MSIEETDYQFPFYNFLSYSHFLSSWHIGFHFQFLETQTHKMLSSCRGWKAKTDSQPKRKKETEQRKRTNWIKYLWWKRKLKETIRWWYYIDLFFEKRKRKLIITGHRCSTRTCSQKESTLKLSLLKYPFIIGWRSYIFLSCLIKSARYDINTFFFVLFFFFFFFWS